MTPSKVIGWREWVSLPGLGIKHIKAKIDTGARTSSLHAFNIELLKRRGKSWVRFEVHPMQRNTDITQIIEAPLLEQRYVTNSGGKRTLRPVIETPIELLGEEVEAELTLIGRSEMGFRMLVGREAMRRRFQVDPGKSYLGGKPKTKKKKRAVGKKAVSTKAVGKKAVSTKAVGKKAVSTKAVSKKKAKKATKSKIKKARSTVPRNTTSGR